MTSRFFHQSSKKKRQNQSLVPYLTGPASKQSRSSLNRVRAFVEDRKFLTNWETVSHEGWRLPATLKKHDWCGLWQTFGCLNSEEHQRLGKGNMIYVKQYQRSCYRSSCKECYIKWIARQANASTRRIEEYERRSKRQPIHLILSVNPNQYHLSYKELRKRAKTILDTMNFTGGAVIFHPFKFNKRTNRWYYAPHFHLVGFVNRSFISVSYGKFGWFVKDKGFRNSVFQTFCYLLSHCGVKKGSHSVSWIGSLSYSKLKVEKEPRITCCPVCQGKFVEIYYDSSYGVHPVVPPDRIYEGLVEDDGCWYPVKTFERPVSDSPCYEYHPKTQINDILKTLCESG